MHDNFKDRAPRLKPLIPNRQTTEAMKAARRGDLVDAGSPEQVRVSLNADDQISLIVSPKAFAEFKARLDAPPRPNKRLRRTMQTRAPWEKKS